MGIEFLDPRQPRCGDVWVNPHNNMEAPPHHPSAKLRHYVCDTPENVLRRWGRMRDEQAIKRAAQVVLDLAVQEGTSVFEAFYLDTTSYVAFVFADRVDRGAAFVNVGHVDHYVEAEWAVAVENKEGIWRTYLPTSRTRPGNPQTPTVTETTCSCSPGELISIYAQCAWCGLRPIDQSEDYDC